MTTKIPLDLASQLDNFTIYNYLQLHNTDNYEQDDAKIICRTKVGDKYKHSVTQYDKDTDLAAEATLFNSTAEITYDMGAFFETSQEADNYITDDDGTMARAVCTIDMIINERNSEDLANIFDSVYEATYGVKLFSNDTTLDPIDTTEQTFKLYLPNPEYDNSFDDVLEEEIANQFFDIDVTTIAGDNTFAFQEFQIKFDTEKEQAKSDKLRVKFILDAPAAVTAAGTTVVQWAQFRLTADLNGDYQGIQCKTVVGTSTESEVESFLGQTSLKDNDVMSTAPTAIATADKQTSTDSSAYVASTLATDFNNTDSDIPDNKKMVCTAELDMPKTDRDHSIFGQWNVTMGARVYDSDTATTFTSLNEQEF